MPSPLRETDLYPPVAEFLEKSGYTVHAEVAGSDITALRDGEILVVELKVRFNLDLVLQAVRRQQTADQVYVAVPLRGGRPYPPRWGLVRDLFRRLGAGVLFVRFRGKEAPVVETALPPGDGRGAKRPSIRKALLREIQGRGGNFNVGGSSGRPIVTAYRTEALRIAELLRDGELSPKALRDRGAGPKCPDILRRNHYRWFEKVSRGLYRLSPAGREALERYGEVLRAAGGAAAPPAARR